MNLTNAKAQQIAHLWVEGRTLDEIAEAGLAGGWTRADAERIAADNQWEIGYDGRCFSPVRRQTAQTPPVAPVVSTAKVGIRTSPRPIREARPHVVGQQFLTVRETAVLMRVSPMTMYRMAHNGELDAKRVGRSIRIPVSAYEAYMAQAEVGGVA